MRLVAKLPRSGARASMNVLLEAPPSEQSVHVAVRMSMPLRLLSCCFAGHAMNGNEHHWHGTFAGSRAATRTCNDSAVGSDHGLFMVVECGLMAMSGLKCAAALCGCASS